MLKKLGDYIMSTNIADATQWLSIRDSAQRSSDANLAALANDKLEEIFDYDSLLTTSTKENHNKAQGGRRVKRE